MELSQNQHSVSTMIDDKINTENLPKQTTEKHFQIDKQSTQNNDVQDKMARTYAKVAESPSNNTVTNDNSNSFQAVKPVFIKEKEIHGMDKPPKEFWVSNVELYKAIGNVIPPMHISGIQRIHTYWRIYLDNDEDKMTILTQGITLRDKSINVYEHNPRYADKPYSISVRVKNVPLSADDGQIERAITSREVEIITIYRERLRVDNKLTNCQQEI